MKLVKFNESTTLLDEFIFREGEVYELNDRLAQKFIGQMAIAEAVDESDNVLPNPAAALFDDDDNLVASVAPPAAAPPPETPPPPPPPAPDTKFKLVGKGGPWFNVVNTDTGEFVNEKPLRKSDAESLMESLTT